MYEARSGSYPERAFAFAEEQEEPFMTTETEFYVRLKPRPEKMRRGVPQTPARYMYRGARFEESRGWCRVTDKTFVDELRTLTHNDREDGIPIFDVCTPAEAKALRDREVRAGKVRRDPEDAHVVAPVVRSRSGAVTLSEIRPEPAPAPPPMIDGADGDPPLEEGDLSLGRLDGDGPEQVLDDGDDLLEQGGREPRAPIMTGGEAVSRPATTVTTEKTKPVAVKPAPAPSSRKKQTTAAAAQTGRSMSREE